jgi:hypothetical protein
MAATSQTAIANRRFAKAGGLCRQACATIGGFRTRLRDGGGASPAVSFGCRSRPARVSSFIFTPIASRPFGLSPPRPCLLASSLILPARSGSRFIFFAGFERFLRENCRRHCGRRGSRRRRSIRSGSSRSKVLSRRWIFAGMARAFFCGFIPPKGLRWNRRRSGFA